jgi:hypothetical protein
LAVDLDLGARPFAEQHTITFSDIDSVAAARANSDDLGEMLKAKAKEAAHRITVGEDKAYDSTNHVANLRAINVTPHVAQNGSVTSTGKRRQSAIDRWTTRHEGYGMSQSRRAMTECIFGTMRKTKHRGIAAVAADFLLNLIAGFFRRPLSLLSTDLASLFSSAVAFSAAPRASASLVDKFNV